MSDRPRNNLSERLSASARWLAVPWSELLVALALIGAAAVPAFLVAASDLWQVAAGDALATTLVSATTAETRALSLSTEGILRADEMEAADDAVTQRLDRIPALTGLVRTVSTFAGFVITDARVVTDAPFLITDDQVITDAPFTARVEGTPAGVPVRLLSRDGALEAIEIIEVAAEPKPADVPGVWVSDWFAEKSGAGPGERVVFASPAEPEEPVAEFAPGAGPSLELEIVGTYRRLWSVTDEALSPYWLDVPPRLLPRYSSPFAAPNFELFIFDEATVVDLGIPAQIRWDAFAPEPPTTLEDLRRLAGSFRALERDLFQDPGLAAAFQELAGLAAAAPDADSPLFEVVSEAEAAVAQLKEPLAASRTAGVVIGLAVMALSSLFLVERRSTEFRLLAGEGDRLPRIALRTGAQLLPPTAVGLLVGVAAAWLVANTVGPATASIDEVALGRVAAIGAGGLMVAALLTGAIGQRALDQGTLGGRRTGALWMLLSLSVPTTVLLWFLAGEGGPGVDLTVIVLPIVGLVAGVGVLLLAIQAVFTRLRRFGNGLRPVWFIAWRRVSRGGSASRLIVAALAVGLGLVAFSTILLDTTQRNTEVKLAAELGSDTRVDLLGPRPTELPSETTVISTSQTRATPGDWRVRVVAIDRETFQDGVDWPTEFGLDADQVLTLLDTPGPNVPLLEVGTTGLATTGGIGLAAPFGYEIVGQIRAAPLAAEFGATVMALRDRIDEAELTRLASSLERPPTDDEVRALYRAPSTRYQHYLVSHLTEGELASFFANYPGQAREIVTRQERLAAVDVLAPRFAFDYLGLLGYVSAVAAVAALLLFLSSAGRQRALAAVMVQRMGLPQSRAALIGVIEISLATAVALLAAAVCAPLLTDRVAPRFDPNPRLPPELGVQVPLATIFGGMAATLALVAVLVFLAESRRSASDPATVMRDAG